MMNGWMAAPNYSLMRLRTPPAANAVTCTLAYADPLTLWPSGSLPPPDPAPSFFPFIHLGWIPMQEGDWDGDVCGGGGVGVPVV
jgi:hypothetical protein